jgi:AAHS family 4-hydroxybenzoate transporter-like MFS transporter
MAAETIKLSETLDRRKVGGFQVGLLAMCALVLFFDGFDAQAIGYVAPNLIREWKLPPGELGPVFSSGLVGLMLGALFIAPLADRFGRRPVILGSTVVFGLFSLVTAWANTAEQLLLLRFLTGLGLGGCMPNAIALTSEYSPSRSRAFLVMLMFNGFSLGSLVGGLLASQFVPVYGWRIVFLVGGILPLAIAPVLYFLLPESIRFLALGGRSAATVARLLNRLDPTLQATAETRVVVETSGAGRMSVRELFRHGRALRTALLWVIFFSSLLDLYMLVNWMPTLMNAVGEPLRTAVLLGALLQLGGIAGALFLGFLIDRKGSGPALIAAYLVATVCIVLIGVFAGASLALTTVAVFGAGFGVIGGQIASNAVAAGSYPTEIRSTGVGWALGIGRIGSIVGPSIGGVLVGMEVPVRQILFLSAGPAVVAVLASIALAAASRPRQAALAGEAAPRPTLDPS